VCWSPRRIPFCEHRHGYYSEDRFFAKICSPRETTPPATTTFVMHRANEYESRGFRRFCFFEMAVLRACPERHVRNAIRLYAHVCCYHMFCSKLGPILKKRERNVVKTFENRCSDNLKHDDFCCSRRCDFGFRQSICLPIFCRASIQTLESHPFQFLGPSPLRVDAPLAYNLIRIGIPGRSSQ